MVIPAGCWLSRPVGGYPGRRRAPKMTWDLSWPLGAIFKGGGGCTQTNGEVSTLKGFTRSFENSAGITTNFLQKWGSKEFFGILRGPKEFSVIRVGPE